MQAHQTKYVPFKITFEMPWGSIIGHLPFELYINDSVYFVHVLTLTIIYMADDSAQSEIETNLK